MTTTPQNQSLDPSVVNLAKAIRSIETKGQKDPYTARGASGEFGAYQYTKETWAGDAKTFLGKDVPLEQADKLMQNEVAYKKLKSLKDKGFNVGQIASIWNSGSPEWAGKVGVNKHGVRYDVPKYVDAVANAYQSIKSGQEPVLADTRSTVGKEERVGPLEANVENTGAFFPSTGQEGPIKAALKTAGNLVPSAFQFAKGVIDVVNPVSTIGRLAESAQEFKELSRETGGAGAALRGAFAALPGAAYETLVPRGTQQLLAGDTEGAQRSFIEDPFGQVAPYVFAAKGAARATDAARARGQIRDYTQNIMENASRPIPRLERTAEQAVDSAVSKTAKTVTEPASYIFGRRAPEPAQALEARLKELRDARGRAQTPALRETLGSQIAEVEAQLQNHPSYAAAGKILQGTTQEARVGARVLSQIDPKKMGTYKEMSSTLGEQIASNLAKVDKEFAASKEVFKLNQLKRDMTGQVGGVKVKASINYVTEALKHLEELYTKTRDVQEAARIKATIQNAKTKGLTADQINKIAREYGTEFGDKAFSKRTGEALTSVNARTYENVRSGVKDTARSMLPSEVARGLDKSTSEMITVKKLADEMVEKVNKLEQRVTERNIAERIGRALGIAVDAITAGGLRAFIAKLLPSNVGLKTLNSIDLQNSLKKNLKLLRQLEGQSDATVANTIVNMLKKANELPESEPVQTGAFGARTDQVLENTR